VKSHDLAIETCDSSSQTEREKCLYELMDLISERRLKFSHHISTFVASNSLGIADEKLAEAYLSGIDDANRLVRFMLGLGEDLSSPDFFKKAAVAKPANYGVHNMPEDEREHYGVEEILDVLAEPAKQLP